MSQGPGFFCICVLFVMHKCKSEVNDGSINFAIYIRQMTRFDKVNKRVKGR